MPTVRPALMDHFLERGFTRRQIGRHIGQHIGKLAAGLSVAGGFHEAALAQMSVIRGLAPDVVKINANENPMGPCPEAAEAMYSMIRRGGRYWYDEGPNMARTLAEVEGLKPEYVAPFAGSSLPLHHAVLAFTSPTRSLVIADPTYEAAILAAKFMGARTHAIPLLKDKGYAHDIRGMLKADAKAGFFYVCNPNNPTGTRTPRAEIEYLVNNKPAGSVVMIDEAYFHLAGDENFVDLVKAEKDVVLLRSFSKIFGMAGLRAGAAIGRPDLLEKINDFNAGALPVTAMVGANVSLRTKGLVPERRRQMSEVRDHLSNWLTSKGLVVIPSVSNMVMVDVKRPAQGVIRALFDRKIIIGRFFPAMPTHVRISVGSREEIDKFTAAFSQVMQLG
ncbi:MAG: aminotransferase class I/II-fold pyridoxal phosphate-dependent enzyme [Acidobacteria bacterium]|nr:aminotransferase class I/II-fold pyridoxal phosphate-dependent enzyme [Acidobacteriota bacterium]